MTALQWLLSLHEVCNFQTKEGARSGPASKSELRRWLQNGVLQINGVRVKHDDTIDVAKMESVILFPKNQKARVTLW